MQSLLERGCYDVYPRRDEYCLINKENGKWLIVNEIAKNILDFVKEPRSENAIFEEFSRKGLSKNSIHRYLHRLILAGLLKKLANKKESPFGEKRQRTLPYLFVLTTSNSCNLACKYCYASSRNENNLFMPLSIMQRTIDVAVTMPHKLIGIEFHGGEPLLQFGDIQKAILYGEKAAKAKNKKLKFLIQSNGTLLNEGIANFIKKHKIDIGISLDGPKDIHDRNRVFPNGQGSHGRIMKNIELLRKKNIKFSVLSVVEDHKDIHRIFNFIASKKIASMKLNFIFPQGRAKGKKALPDETTVALYFENIVNKLLEFYKRNQKMKEANLGFLIENLVSPESTERYMCLNSPCGSMFDMVAIDMTGNIFPCEKMVSIGYFRRNFCIGNIQTTKDFKHVMLTSKIRHALWNRNVDSMKGCVSCSWKRFCSGGCLADAYLRNKTIYSRGLYCTFYKTLFEKIIWKIYEKPDTLLKIFDFKLN